MQLLWVFSVGNSGSCWHVGGTQISAAYKAFSPEKFTGELGVFIGLDHANITLDAIPDWELIREATSSANVTEYKLIDVHFNER